MPLQILKWLKFFFKNRWNFSSSHFCWSFCFFFKFIFFETIVFINIWFKNIFQTKLVFWVSKESRTFISSANQRKNLKFWVLAKLVRRITPLGSNYQSLFDYLVKVEEYTESALRESAQQKIDCLFSLSLAPNPVKKAKQSSIKRKGTIWPYDQLIAD